MVVCCFQIRSEYKRTIRSADYKRGGSASVERAQQWLHTLLISEVAAVTHSDLNTLDDESSGYFAWMDAYTRSGQLIEQLIQGCDLLPPAAGEASLSDSEAPDGEVEVAHTTDQSEDSDQHKFDPVMLWLSFSQILQYLFHDQRVLKGPANHFSARQAVQRQAAVLLWQNEYFCTAVLWLIGILRDEEGNDSVSESHTSSSGADDSDDGEAVGGDHREASLLRLVNPIAGIIQRSADLVALVCETRLRVESAIQEGNVEPTSLTGPADALLDFCLQHGGVYADRLKALQLGGVIIDDSSLWRRNTILSADDITRDEEDVDLPSAIEDERTRTTDTLLQYLFTYGFEDWRRKVCQSVKQRKPSSRFYDVELVSKQLQFSWGRPIVKLEFSLHRDHPLHSRVRSGKFVRASPAKFRKLLEASLMDYPIISRGSLVVVSQGHGNRSKPLLAGVVTASPELLNPQFLLPEEIFKAEVAIQIMVSEDTGLQLRRIMAATSCSMVDTRCLPMTTMPPLDRLKSLTVLPLAQEILNHRAGRKALHTPIVPDYLRHQSDWLEREMKESTVFGELDDSQQAAARHCFTTRLGLVQGPPGTGKTRLGVAIVDLCLRLGFRVLVQTYTNHALDDFLESIIDLEVAPADPEVVVRLGGRTKSERVKQLTLKQENMRTERTARTIRELNAAQQRARIAWQSCNATVHGRSWEVLHPFMKSNPGEFDQELRALRSTSTRGGFRTTGPSEHDAVFKRWYAGDTTPPAIVEEQLHGPEYALARDMWTWSIEQRKTMMQEWIDRANAANFKAFTECMKAVQVAQSNHGRAMSEYIVQHIRQAKLIACTTTGAAIRGTMLQDSGVDVVICEEAGEVLESALIGSLPPSLQHLIMIGDHKQLRPKVNSYDFQAENPRRCAKFNVSLFERLAVRTPPPQLHCQHRMRPEISELLRDVYPELEDAPSTLDRPDVNGMSANVAWVNVDGEEEGDSTDVTTASKRNELEAQWVVHTLLYLLQQGHKPSQFVILAPYKAQVLHIRALLAKERIATELNELDAEEAIEAGLDVRDPMAPFMRAAVDSSSEREEASTSPADGDDSDSSGEEEWRGSDEVLRGLNDLCCGQRVRVSSVDNFQGEEADIVLLSMVRVGDKIGFVAQERRLTVALSRARMGMYMFGHQATFERHSNWNRILKHLQRDDMPRCGVYSGLPIAPSCRNSTSAVTARLLHSPGEFIQSAPDGCCDKICGEVMPDCGHPCLLHCHPIPGAWESHSHMVCQYRTKESCKRGHPRVKICDTLQKCWLCKEEDLSDQVAAVQNQIRAAAGSAIGDNGRMLQQQLNKHQQALKRCQTDRKDAERQDTKWLEAQLRTIRERDLQERSRQRQLQLQQDRDHQEAERQARLEAERAERKARRDAYNRQYDAEAELQQSKQKKTRGKKGKKEAQDQQGAGADHEMHSTAAARASSVRTQAVSRPSSSQTAPSATAARPVPLAAINTIPSNAVADRQRARLEQDRRDLIEELDGITNTLMRVAMEEEIDSLSAQIRDLGPRARG